MVDIPSRSESGPAGSSRFHRVKNLEDYRAQYARSLQDPDTYWAEQARRYLSWNREWDFVLRYDEDQAAVEWFGGGRLNAAANCLDRHLQESAGRVAYYLESEDPARARAVTYDGLFHMVNRFAVLLKSLGVRKGDTVALYLPMPLETVVGMLACARIGAVHCAVFSGFGTEAVAVRLRDCNAKVVVTADAGRYAGKIVPVKSRLDEALERCPDVETVVVIDHCGTRRERGPVKEVEWEDPLSETPLPAIVPPESMDAEDPLFVFHASAAIGPPRALVHTHGGYLLWAAMTTKLIFDLRDDDVFLNTWDIALAAGHTVGVYGTLLNGITGVLCEGAPDYPARGRYWKIVEKLRVTKLSTSPAAVRMPAAQADECPAGHDVSSLEIIGCTGEAIDTPAMDRLHGTIGGQGCTVLDNWWQSESGGPMLTPLPGVSPAGPGSVGLPFFGVEPIILDLDTGEEASFPNQEGAFFIARPWPGMARTIYRDHEAFLEAYYAPFPGLFLTGDGAKRDEHGFYRMTGRIDDVINVSGHRLGSWELEQAIGSHPLVREATAVGFAVPEKGQGIYAFVTLRPDADRSQELKQELQGLLVKRIGFMARPDVIQWADALPKTRSGKILRRILQKIASGERDLGNTSTVADPSVLGKLVRDRMAVPL